MCPCSALLPLTALVLFYPYLQVRWWSRWEVVNQLSINFSSLGPFLNRVHAEGLCEATIATLLDIHNNDNLTLRLEMAAVLDLKLLQDHHVPAGR